MHFRAATRGDRDLLAYLLLQAFTWDGTGRVTPDDIACDPHLRVYVDGWKQSRDFGVIAMEHHQPIAGLWGRALTSTRAGYGYVADDVPEITMAVMPERRGAGVGGALLAESIVRARALGWRGISLSVEDGNSAARRLYERHGFVVVGRKGGSDTMFRDL